MKTYKILLVILTMMGFTSPIFSQWIVQHSGIPASDNNLSIKFSAVNSNVCWGIQQQIINPKCILTTNGGDNWELFDLQGIAEINTLWGMDIFAMSADTAWVTLQDSSGGTNGGVFKTTNGGKDWVKQETAFTEAGARPESIYFFNANNGLTIGGSRDRYWEIYTTADGGTNWTRVPKETIPAAFPGNQYFPNDDLVYQVPKGFSKSYWFASLFRSIYKTTDMGHTWSVVRNIPSSYGIAVNIAFKDSMNGLAGSFFGEKRNQLSRTTDGGVSWKPLLQAPPRPSNGFLTYVPGTEGTYIITSHSNNGAVEPMLSGSAYTLDNGDHWTLIDGLEHGFVTFTTGNVGWSTGTGDTIYKWNGIPFDTVHTDIVPKDAVVKKLSSDQFYFINGPVWYRDSVLLFSSDDPANIYSYDPLINQFKVFRSNTGSNGLTLDKDKNLLACTPKVVMLDKTGRVMKTLAEGYNNKAFTSPNDIIADNKGGAYFSDITFFGSQVQDKEAVYYVDSTGTVKRVIDDLQKPNGLVLSPDGKKLYVDDSFDKYLFSWDVAPDGSLSGKSILTELETIIPDTSRADGMAIDIHRNIYVCSDVGIQVFSPQGDSLTVIAFPERPSNCDFGGKDFKTLFVTTNANLYSIDLNYPGFAVSRKGPWTGTKAPLLNHITVELYPNPVSNLLYVSHNLDKVNSIDIVNIAGKKESIFLKKPEGSRIEINTQKLQSGLYILRIVADEGVVTRKFVKQ